MASDLIPRLRPPTFATPPEGLQQVTVNKEGGDYFKIEVPFADGVINPTELSKIVWYALWDIFGSSSFATSSEFKIGFHLSSPHQLKELSREIGIDTDDNNPDLFTISRAWWYQRYQIFSYPDTVEVLTNCDSERSIKSDNKELEICHVGKKLQSDMPPPTETVYQKYISHLNSYFCLSVYGDSPQELELLHGWLNDPRVDEYWKDAGDREFHVKWLRERYEDRHVLPILGSYRGTNGADKNAIEPFAYYEIYWAAEDKISKAYATEEFDRGIHMLVGSSLHRGPHRVRSWLPALIHFIFSDDLRTKKIISEPDHRNLKMINYLQQFGFKRVKSFDFGHKIAAIMVLDRDHFWNNCPL